MAINVFQERMIEREKAMNNPVRYQTLFQELSEQNLWVGFFQEWIKGHGSLIQTMGERKISLPNLKNHVSLLNEEEKRLLFEGFQQAWSNLPFGSYRTLSFRQIKEIDPFLLSLFDDTTQTRAFFDWYQNQSSCFVGKEGKSYRGQFLEACVMTNQPHVVRWSSSVWNKYAHGLVTPLSKKAIWHKKHQALAEMTNVFNFSSANPEILVSAVYCQDVEAVKILLPVCNARKGGSQALLQATIPKRRDHDDTKQSALLSLLVPQSDCLEAFKRADTKGKEKLVPFLSNNHVKTLAMDEALVGRIPSLMKRVLELNTQEHVDASLSKTRKI